MQTQTLNRPIDVRDRRPRFSDTYHGRFLAWLGGEWRVVSFRAYKRHKKLIHYWQPMPRPIEAQS